MEKKEYFIDDRVTIPVDIKNMTQEELQKAIDEFEKELKKKRETA